MQGLAAAGDASRRGGGRVASRCLCHDMIFSQCVECLTYSARQRPSAAPKRDDVLGREAEVLQALVGLRDEEGVDAPRGLVARGP